MDTEMQKDAAPPSDPKPPGYVSKLTDPKQRFLAAVIDHALSSGLRTPSDFLSAFPPREIMTALKDEPRLRAKLLVATIGLNEKVALKKSAASAGEDLELALTEKVSDAATIVALFEPDDRIRLLDRDRLWAFLSRGEFWNATEASAVALARTQLRFIVDRARAEKLISDRDFIDAVGLGAIVDALPRFELTRLLAKALAEGREGRPYRDDAFLGVVSPAEIVDSLTPAHVWEHVIAAKLAPPSRPSQSVAGAPAAAAARSESAAEIEGEAPASVEIVTIVEEESDEITSNYELEVGAGQSLRPAVAKASAPPPSQRPEAAKASAKR
jgi:hypothetical protein